MKKKESGLSRKNVKCIGVKRPQKQLRKAKVNAIPEYSDAEDTVMECNTFNSNSIKTQLEHSFQCEEDIGSICNISNQMKSYKRIQPECPSDSEEDMLGRESNISKSYDRIQLEYPTECQADTRSVNNVSESCDRFQLVFSSDSEEEMQGSVSTISRSYDSIQSESSAECNEGTLRSVNNMAQSNKLQPCISEWSAETPKNETSLNRANSYENRTSEFPSQSEDKSNKKTLVNEVRRSCRRGKTLLANASGKALKANKQSGQLSSCNMQPLVVLSRLSQF